MKTDAENYNRLVPERIEAGGRARGRIGRAAGRAGRSGRRGDRAGIQAGGRGGKSGRKENQKLAMALTQL
jgi:hypothetical protein